MYFKGIYRLFAIHYFFIITFSCADSKDSKSTAKVVEKSEFSDANVYQQEEKGEEIFQAVKDTPKFIGGKKKMYEFINANIRHPREAAEKGVSGLVYVRFVIEKKWRNHKSKAIERNWLWL